jgi:hypothetical protein
LGYELIDHRLELYCKKKWIKKNSILKRLGVRWMNTIQIKFLI